MKSPRATPGLVACAITLPPCPAATLTMRDLRFYGEPT